MIEDSIPQPSFAPEFIEVYLVSHGDAYGYPQWGEAGNQLCGIAKNQYERHGYYCFSWDMVEDANSFHPGSSLSWEDAERELRILRGLEEI